MSGVSHKVVVREIVESALRELSDAEFQQRVWVSGSPIEMSSMNEAAAALFNDSGLDEALEKNDVTFTREADAELRGLRIMLRASLADQDVRGTAAVIESVDWGKIRDRATHVLELLGVRH